MATSEINFTVPEDYRRHMPQQAEAEAAGDALTLKQVRDLRYNLERAVFNLLGEFERETGIVPERVDIKTTDELTTRGRTHKRVYDVEIRLREL